MPGIHLGSRQTKTFDGITIPSYLAVGAIFGANLCQSTHQVYHSVSGHDESLESFLTRPAVVACGGRLRLVERPIGDRDSRRCRSSSLVPAEGHAAGFGRDIFLPFRLKTPADDRNVGFWRRWCACTTRLWRSPFNLERSFV